MRMCAKNQSSSGQNSVSNLYEDSNEHVVCEIYTAIWDEILMFRVVAPCTMMTIYLHSGGTCCIYLPNWRWVEDGDNKFLQNVSVRKEVCMAQQPKDRSLILRCWRWCKCISPEFYTTRKMVKKAGSHERNDTEISGYIKGGQFLDRPVKWIPPSQGQ
jgi:hypothetical protein